MKSLATSATKQKTPAVADAVTTPPAITTNELNNGFANRLKMTIL